VSPATPTVAALPRTLEPQPAPAASPEPAPAAAEYTLLIGEYSSKAAVNPLLKKLKKAGFEPELGPGPKKKEQMVRLYFGEFLRLDLAKKEIARLRGAKVEAFFLKEEDQIYRVYVGSYASEQGAELERRRLAAQGITLLPKRVSVLVPTYQLTLGSYPDRAKAREQLLELEKKGFSAELREVVTEVPAPQGQ
jgi:cell division septation protein DedD